MKINKELKEFIILLLELPFDIINILTTKKGIISIYTFIKNLTLVLSLIVLFFYFMGEITKLGHGDKEFQNQHTHLEQIL